MAADSLALETTSQIGEISSVKLEYSRYLVDKVMGGRTAPVVLNVVEILRRNCTLTVVAANLRGQLLLGQAKLSSPFQNRATKCALRDGLSAFLSRRVATLISVALTDRFVNGQFQRLSIDKGEPALARQNQSNCGEGSYVGLPLVRRSGQNVHSIIIELLLYRADCCSAGNVDFKSFMHSRIQDPKRLFSLSER